MLITQLNPEHQVFRESLRSFIQKEILPNVDTWEENGEIDKSIWKKMGDMGYLGLIFPEEYGGLNLEFDYSKIFCEELSQCFSGGFTISALVIEYMSATYLWKYGSEFLKEKYLTQVIAGEMVSAVAITEPGAGSDVQNIKTTAVDEGDHFVVNGSKTFITNGYYGDFFYHCSKNRSQSWKKRCQFIAN
ncbi:acyl-CoA dehydrogenase family protein [Sphingobacterium daejeonense]|uniref:acyl-CoA dehydrogenase family protein n=1 Tax=Sphingobacterium daejeonense TaxID=371142 RepID=UPI0010C2B6BC|nr:acyl-CoA dehydrogenase family protein [Sphingobacterium daejeonense]VTP93298.1 (R)-benzylsuccinyl-CoA dehydrogenase [Sphingobacterium daejeonense]